MTFVAPYTLQDFVKFASTTKIMQCYGNMLEGTTENDKTIYGSYRACIWGAVAIEAGLAVVIYNEKGFAMYLDYGPKWVHEYRNEGPSEGNIAKHFGMLSCDIISLNDTDKWSFQNIATEVMMYPSGYKQPL